MIVVALPDGELPPHPDFGRAYQVLPSLLAFDPARWGSGHGWTVTAFVFSRRMPPVV
jgi:hypothetical protein